MKLIVGRPELIRLDSIQPNRLSIGSKWVVHRIDLSIHRTFEFDVSKIKCDFSWVAKSNRVVDV